MECGLICFKNRVIDYLGTLSSGARNSHSRVFIYGKTSRLKLLQKGGFCYTKWVILAFLRGKYVG